MTQTTGRFFDEFAKMMTNAAGMAQGLRNETETVLRAQAERFLNEFEVVQREEFEAVREMAVKAREENERLEQRIAELEAALADFGAQDRKPAARKSVAKKAVAKRSAATKRSATTKSTAKKASASRAAGSGARSGPEKPQS